MEPSLPPWQETTKQLLGAECSLEKALQAEEAKNQTTSPTKAEATERFQKATSQLKKVGQAKAQAENSLKKAKEQVALREAQLQATVEGLQEARAEVEASSKVYWKYALEMPADGEDAAEGQGQGGDDNLAHLILANMGEKLLPDQQQRLLEMAGRRRDQKRRKVEETPGGEGLTTKAEPDQTAG